MWAFIRMLDILSSVKIVTSSQSLDEKEEQNCTELSLSTIAQAQIHYNELKQFIENKLEASDGLFVTLNKIENVAINSKTRTKTNTFCFRIIF